MATVDCYREQGMTGLERDRGRSRLTQATIADAGHSEVARAEADLSSVCGGGSSRSARSRNALHRIAEVREQQGVTLRNVARRLRLPLTVVRRQEQADCDLRLSDLLRWQEVLEVPVADLLVEGEGQLSGPVLARSRMVKLMKTAAALRERTAGTAAARMTEMLVEQILELMPELADVGPWHTALARRPLDDVGRTARCTVSDELFGRDAT